MVVYALTFIQDLSNANLAIIGIPFDTRAAYRVGACFGPQDIRPAAVPLHLYNSDPIRRLANMSRTISQNEMIGILSERTPKSKKLWQESQDVVPGGLLSAARKFKPYPFYTDRGQGPYIWDVDDNRYIDCCMSYGVLLLGHRPPVIEEAITAQLKKGTVYGTPHPLEIAFANRFIECVPCAERMLLCNSGTEATMQGIRIMRAFTGRDKIAKFEGCYHGWHDYAMWSVSPNPEKMGPAEKPNAVAGSAGIPKAVEDTLLVLPFDEHAFDLIEENASELAGVMIEPVVGGLTLPVGKDFLQTLREVTQRTGVLLMFDEVITGFRMALGGAQEFHGVLPDLATYGKIIGGGLPIGAVGCSKAMMDTVLNEDMSIAIAGTFSGNPITLAAGYALIGYLMENPQIYDELTAKGDRLRSGFNRWASDNDYPASMTGVASLFQTHLKAPPFSTPRELIDQPHDALGALQLYLRMNGVFIPWLHLAFISTAHSDEDIEEVLRIHQESVAACLTGS